MTFSRKGAKEDAKAQIKYFLHLCGFALRLCLKQKASDMKLKRLSILTTLLLISIAAVAQQSQPSAEKLQQHVSYLASDALDGRRTGTAGANDAARYIAGEFSRAGLMPGNGKAARKPRAIIASYLQTFPYVGRVELGKNNVLSLVNTDVGLEMRVGEDWMPLGISANQTVSL